MPPHPRLVDLADQVAALARSPEHERRRRRWIELLELRSTAPLLNFYAYPHVWAAELAGHALQLTDGLEADLERQLAFRLWRAARVPDDTPVDPQVVLAPVRPPRRRPFPWGLELALARPDGVGSYKPVPPLRSEEDLERLQMPAYEEDRGATGVLLARARELVDDRVAVRLHSDELHWGPFEHAVRLRGMDALLLDVYDRPAFVHRLMARLTDGMVAYHRQRQAAGRVWAGAGIGHVPPLPPPAGLEQRLRGAWGYLHAQSAASYSPAMYAEFVQPYNVRIAELVGKVYYHGCEDLSAKAATIRGLPGLRLFHVSPWTPPAPVIAALGERLVYEVHAHPTTVLYADSPAALDDELSRLHEAFRGLPHVWALADLETFAGRFERIERWAATARRLAERS